VVGRSSGGARNQSKEEPVSTIIDIWQLLNGGRVEANNKHMLYLGNGSHSVNMCRSVLTKMERDKADCICELEC